ncbi:MAG: hypothetical protein ACI9JN_002305 [Bacteroidia bacterium]|jgi:hypothetical protein
MPLKITLVICALLILGNQQFSRQFPSFELQTSTGDTLTNDFFLGKTTIVCMGHIECFPALILMNDLDSLSKSFDTSQYQILCILENTQEHIDLFYHDSISTHWRSMRSMLNIDTLHYPLIPECQTQNLVVSGTDTLIGKHCRVLSKKVRTKDSPTILLVDEKGNIKFKDKGYIALASKEERMLFLNEFLMNH